MLGMWSIEINHPASTAEVFDRIHRQPGVFWLDRCTPGKNSFMSFAPSAQLRVGRDGRAYRCDQRGETAEAGEPMEAIARFVREAPPFGENVEAPRTVGYLGYEFGQRLEPHIAARPTAPSQPPLAWFGRYDAILTCTPETADAHGTCRLRIDATHEAAGKQLLQALEADRPTEPAPPPIIRGHLLESPIWSEYEAALNKALDYIAAGDIYQVNLARRFRIQSALPPPLAYLRLRATQPVPYGAYIDVAPFAILSNSPERFLRVRGGHILTEPIKGTRLRSPDPRTDRELGDALRRDSKERAEHIMIVDLERNDLGRICTRGSVDVSSLMRLESFQTVHHLVSTIEGRLKKSSDMTSILKATFPGGSITGAPKIRASEVIAELEPHQRGPYTGTLLWLRSEQDFDSSIAIRTAVSHGDVYSYHAGSGIVADSTARSEYAECWLKANAFLSALLGDRETARLLEASRIPTLAEAEPRS